MNEILYIWIPQIFIHLITKNSLLNMPPHGNGFAGGMHSHDPEYPDDTWNLYSMIDREGTTALNVVRPEHTIGIFKPYALKLNQLPEIISDADQEIMVILNNS